MIPLLFGSAYFYTGERALIKIEESYSIEELIARTLNAQKG